MKPQYLWNVPSSVIRFAESVAEELEGFPGVRNVDLEDRISRAAPVQPNQLQGRDGGVAMDGIQVSAMSVALFEMRKRQLYNMLMRIRNGSAVAVRLCEMFDRGEIGGDRLLDLLGGKHAGSDV